MRIVKTIEYIRWLETLPGKNKSQIDSRMLRIEFEEHWGHHRQLTKELSELKFNNGIRIYYVVLKLSTKTMILLLGGNKNGQQKDIHKALRLAQEIIQAQKL